MQNLIKLLDKSLRLLSTTIQGDNLYLYVESENKEAQCPYCRCSSSRVHSVYNRSFQDLPVQGKKTIIILTNKKWFCDHANCSRRTFAESYSFISPKSKKTERLKKAIIQVSTSMSAMSAERYLKNQVVHIGKSTICELLKKEKSSL